MTLYASFPEALNRAKERSAAKASDTLWLTELLQLSVGIHRSTGEVVFRPFYVAAKYLEQSRRDQTLKEADGAKFTNQVTPIESLLDLQRSLDADLIIPVNFQIALEQPSAATLKANYEAALLMLQQFQPRGFY